jgi:hypothetical protein
LLYSPGHAAVRAGEMSEHDPKRIAREWNREIDREIRRFAQMREDGKWKIVVWVALALLWFAALFVGLSLVRSLQW